MKTIITYSAHGHGPYLMAAGIGRELGFAIVNGFPRFRDIQEAVLKKWYGNDSNIFIDNGSGDILSRIDFFGNYRDFVKRNLSYGEDVREELRDYVRGFDAVSLTGKKKTFKNPSIRISVGARFVPEPEKTFFAFPALTSQVANWSPFGFKRLHEFASVAQKEEKSYKIIFMPEPNAFSYTRRKKLPREISVPPLTHALKSNIRLRKSVFYNLSGATDLQDSRVIDAARQTQLQLYKSIGSEGPGLPKGPEVVFNKSCMAQVARSGWGTIWMCILARKPIITPAFVANDDPEMFHNQKTIEKLDIGVVFKKINHSVMENAIGKVASIKKVRTSLLRKYGTLNGLHYVAAEIRRIEGRNA